MNCQKIHTLLSEYVDNALSARATWEVDKHLAACHHCTRMLNEMRRTVEAVASAPRFEVSGDFMEKLQARLANVEPEPPRRAWLSGLEELFRPRLRPVWGAALGTCALTAVMLVSSKEAVVEHPVPSLPAVPAMVTVAQTQNIALTANDPLGDAAAASMQANGDEGGIGTFGGM
jgi:anti-sigma factor RsiW